MQIRLSTVVTHESTGEVLRKEADFGLSSLLSSHSLELRRPTSGWPFGRCSSECTKSPSPSPAASASEAPRLEPSSLLPLESLKVKQIEINHRLYPLLAIHNLFMLLLLAQPTVPIAAGQPSFEPQATPSSLASAARTLQLDSSIFSAQTNQPLSRPHPILMQGPGLDLVAFNRRRFELDHNHHSSTTASEKELRLGELIESNVNSAPEQILSALPDELNRQVLDSLASDPTLLGSSEAAMLVGSDESWQDPDGASIERLTKSCLTVHASSARPEQLNVTFHLYTKNNPRIAHILSPHVSRADLIKSSPFNPGRPIKWITHGFHTNVDKSEWMLETKDKILAFEDANVILTDWRRGASPALAFYPKAAANAHVVAKMIVRILRRLRSDLDLSRVHLIGHSLGAHIMGFVGSAFTEEYLQQQQQVLMMQSDLSSHGGEPPAGAQSVNIRQLIGRITACDPALPCFGPTSSGPNSPNQSPIAAPPAATGNPDSLDDWTPSMWTHLRPDSAVVVEVIHSNPGVMGYLEPLGDFDFYPNGYERQPGCGAPESAGASPAYPQAPRRTRRQLISNLIGSILGPRPQLSAEQTRLSHTLDRFIRPIRDFLHGYTCSHHRAVEYMVGSLYYELVPPDRRLDRDFVCQMVGYRCADYASFKRGFCFKCIDELDCRALTMTSNSAPASHIGHQSSLASQYYANPSARSLDLLQKFNLSPISHNQTTESNSTRPRAPDASRQIAKRVLPTFNRHNQHHRKSAKNQYFFDTRPTKNFCLHHYHLLVRYRWFRVRQGVALDGFRLIGTLATISQSASMTLNRFTHQAYTLLLTEPIFLGQIESLVVFGEKIKPTLVDYIELTYMSNLDAKVRALGSARLCRSQQPVSPKANHLQAHKPSSKATSFVRCSGTMV